MLNFEAHPVLGQVALGYAPIVDAQRNIVATRLTIALDRPDADIDASALLAALHTVWPPATPTRRGAAVATGAVVLNAVGEPLWRALLQAPPAAPFALEVPSFMLADRNTLAQLVALQRDGGELWLKGSVPATMPAPLWALFRHVLVEVPEPAPAHRGNCSAVAAGLASLADLDAAVKRGCVGGAGWPFAPEPASGAAASGKAKAAPELQMVMDLMARVDREEPIDKLEAALKGDPTLAFRLLRYLNSAAFGMTVEISSLRHALMLLGYAKLKRWLALLLASASKDPNLRPVMHAAVRRGMVMEELARSLDDAEMRGEIFICGVFSLLDRMLGQPFEALFANVLVPERVRQALVEQSGPFMPYLALVQAIEAASPYDLREAADTLMLGSFDLNVALLRALAGARTLD